MNRKSVWVPGVDQLQSLLEIIRERVRGLANDTNPRDPDT